MFMKNLKLNFYSNKVIPQAISEELEEAKSLIFKLQAKGSVVWLQTQMSYRNQFRMEVKMQHLGKTDTKYM